MIFRSVLDRLDIPNISVTMNDCVDRLAVLYLQLWVFTLNIPGRFSKTRQPYITHAIIFRIVSVRVCFPHGSVSGTQFLFISFALIVSQTVSCNGLGKEY